MIRRSKLGPVPEDTAKAARASFKRKQSIYVQFADTFGELFDFSDFSETYSSLGQSAVHPVRLLLLIMVAYLEGLSDRQVAEALAARIDLKYLLCLPLDHSGYDHSVLSEMRDRLIEGQLDMLLFDRILAFAEGHELLKTAKQRTDSTVILSAAKRLSRLELVIETLTHALDVLSEVCPRLVLSVATTFEQTKAYEISGFQFRLPKKEADQVVMAEAVGRDGMRILNAIDQSDQASFLNDIESVRTLKLVWEQQFKTDNKSGPKFRKQEELIVAAEQIGSPHDLDARLSAKRNENKFGYSVHITECCVEGSPRLITNVLTTPATTSDSKSLDPIEKSLRAHGRKPKEHLIDAGYTKGEYMLKALEQHETEQVGPIRGGNSWQTLAGKGFEASRFVIDWQKRLGICPQGKLSNYWTDRTRGNVEVRFNIEDCSVCPVRSDCTKGKVRTLELKPQHLQEFIARQKKYQQTGEFAKQYAPRAGVEGTMSKIKQPDAARARYMGIRKTNLHEQILAAGINAVRILRFLLGTPMSRTRKRPFNRLMAAAA